MKYKLVMIEWTDSQLGSQGWKFIDEQDHELPLMRSVGFLVNETKDFKVLYPHLSMNTENQNGSGDILIPTSAIKQCLELSVNKKKKA